MNVKKYIITAKNSPLSIVFEYDSKGRLNAFKLDGDATNEQYEWIIGKIPLNEKSIESFRQMKKSFKIEEVPLDLSFDFFWDTYAYKHGKKKLAMNNWNKLDENEKIKALNYIKQYRQFCQSSQRQMADGSTYINQQYWDN